MQDGKPVLQSVNGRPAGNDEYKDRFELSPDGQVIEYAEPDVFYENDGKGHLTPVSWTGGRFLDEEGIPLKQAPRDWGLSAQFRDLNGDLKPDLLVCNDLFTPDRIWIQQEAGKFKALSPLNWRRTSTFSMGVDVADVDRDGDWDFFMTDMATTDPFLRHIQVGEMRPRWWPIGDFEDTPQVPFNTLQVQRGDGTFMEVSHFAGVQASEWSWGPVFLDVDLDGYEDLLIPNGQIWDTQNADLADRIEAAKKNRRFTHRELLRLVSAFPSLETENIAFRNLGGWRFERMEKAWGFNHKGITHGMALGDLDRDGDQDVVMNNLNGPAGLLRNNSLKPRILVRLNSVPSAGKTGSVAPTQGIGSKVSLIGKDSRQVRELISGGRYLSGDYPSATFAAGELQNNLNGYRLEILWGGGRSLTLEDVSPNRIYEIELPPNEASVESPQLTEEISQAGLVFFEDISDEVSHQHHENLYDDFKRQPLLPRRLSQNGPAVGFSDSDSDGVVEILIGGGSGSDSMELRRSANGSWISQPLSGGLEKTDVAALADLGLSVLKLNAAYETASGLVNPLSEWGGRDDDQKYSAINRVLRPEVSYESLAVGDIEGDGDLDLFIGARVKGGSYPESGSSWICKREPDRSWTVGQEFQDLGMVSSAVFSDWSGDGFPDLVVAVEWGAVELFENNQQGQFVRRSAELGTDGRRGLWLSLATGDWNQDGRMDIAVGNWGENSMRQASPERPLNLYYGDWEGNGTMDLFEMRNEPELGFESSLRPLQTLRMAVPSLVSRARTFTQFARTPLEKLGGAKWKQLSVKSVVEMEHGVFWNYGDRFEWERLPDETQLTPATAVVSGDLDGDGWEDLFVAQNWFAVNPDDVRQDAGRGLWLRNAEGSGWDALDGAVSGIQVYGEQRSVGLLDWNGDRRLDLLVTQNGAQTRFFENRLSKVGVRIELKGPPGNPRGYGAQLWWENQSGERSGVFELTSSFGGKSALTPYPVLFPSQRLEPDKLAVRWPGGKISTAVFSSKPEEIRIDWSTQR